MWASLDINKDTFHRREQEAIALMMKKWLKDARTIEVTNTTLVQVTIVTPVDMGA